ncbi:MAG: Hsp20 family protein [Kiloniellaceae bacterium]
MRSIDLTPLMRATVGFDRMMTLLDAVSHVDEGTLSYPPYNIEKTGENDYRITMAVAGFGEDDLDVTVKENSLVIVGKMDKDEAGDGKFLHRGIATRAFERRFDLADYIRATGARLENGLLHIDLVRELPEAMKPRRIKIATRPAAEQKVIGGKAA